MSPNSWNELKGVPPIIAILAVGGLAIWGITKIVDATQEKGDSNGEIVGAMGIILVSAILVTSIGGVIYLQRHSPEQNQKRVGYQLQNGGIVSFLGSLEEILGAINSAILDIGAQNVMVKRLLPTEFTEVMFPSGKPPECLREYHKLMKEIIQGGSVGLGFQDQTIYGLVDLPTHNEKTMAKIEEWYFDNTNPPDTTFLGFDASVNYYGLILVGETDGGSSAIKHWHKLIILPGVTTGRRFTQGIMIDASEVKEDAEKRAAAEGIIRRYDEEFVYIKQEAVKANYASDFFPGAEPSQSHLHEILKGKLAPPPPSEIDKITEITANPVLKADGNRQARSN